MVITASGVIIRMAVNDISQTGRNTQGVKLIRLGENDNEFVSTVAVVEREEDTDEAELEASDSPETTEQANDETNSLNEEE